MSGCHVGEGSWLGAPNIYQCDRRQRHESWRGCLHTARPSTPWRSLNGTSFRLTGAADHHSVAVSADSDSDSHTGTIAGSTRCDESATTSRCDHSPPHL